MKLKCERGANDRVLIHGRDIALLHPFLPVPLCLVQEPLSERMKRLFNGSTPGQYKVPPSSQRERRAGNVGDRNVCCQTEMALKAFKSHVIRSVETHGYGLGPTEPRLADHANAWSAFDGLDNSVELCWPECPVVLIETRREVHDLKRACRSLKRRS